MTLPMARESFKPTLFQDFPASTDFQTPSPWEMFPRMQASPVPTYTMLGSDRATAILPMEGAPSLSKIGDQVLAPSVDFQTPPPVAPK